MAHFIKQEDAFCPYCFYNLELEGENLPPFPKKHNISITYECKRCHKKINITCIKVEYLYHVLKEEA